MQWARFALARDWLEECELCVGPILLVDVRDTIFQLDPFGPDSPPIRGLHLFQEHQIANDASLDDEVADRRMQSRNTERTKSYGRSSGWQ